MGDFRIPISAVRAIGAPLVSKTELLNRPRATSKRIRIILNSIFSCKHSRAQRTWEASNLIFEGDLHPMPSEWDETKLSSRHGDEEHAICLNRSLLPSISVGLAEPPRGTETRKKLVAHIGRVPPFHGCHSEPRLPGAKAPGDQAR